MLGPESCVLCMGALVSSPYLCENPFVLSDFCFIFLNILKSMVIKGPPVVNEESFQPAVELEANLAIIVFLTLWE